MPQPVVEHHHGAGGSGELLFTGDVLVAVETRRTNAAQVAAGNEACATFAGSDVVGIPEQLDVEGQVGRVGDRVDVEGLDVRGVRLDVVGEVVVERRVRSDERLDDPADLWQAQVVTDR